MNKQIKSTAITACFTLMSVLAMAQVNGPEKIKAPVAGERGPIPPPPGKHKGGPERREALKVLTSVSGKVIAYQANDRYAYNSFTLQNGSQVTTVRFPEQLGKQLMGAAGKGQSVTVKGFTDSTDNKANVFQLVSLSVNGTQIMDVPPTIPIVPATTQPGLFTGTISNFKRDQQGMIRGINLDSKVQVDLPPAAIEQLQPLLKTGDKVKVNGFKESSPSGVALVADAPTVIHPQSIEVNGQTYLLR